jgi:uncharacterized protein (TIGR03435 family)
MKQTNDSKHKTKALVGALVLALVVAAVVKFMFFPSIRNDYFALNQRSLLQVPAGLLVFRPTRFPYLRQEETLYVRAPHGGDHDVWMVGRNAPLREVIAAAYEEKPGYVVLPPDASKGNFDFLVTVKRNQTQQLRAIIRRKLGYIAQIETRDTEVLALKVANGQLSGLTVSGDDEKRSAAFDDLKIHFTNMPVVVVIQVLESYLDQPMVDKTGLTNFYDYAMAYDAQTRFALQDSATARSTVDKVVQPLGLKLESDMASVEVLVVNSAPR